MPIIKSAKKKLRKDYRKTRINLKYKVGYEKIINKIRKNKSNKKELPDLIKKAYSQLDKAAKKKIIHKNKVARLKSSIARLLK